MADDGRPRNLSDEDVDLPEVENELDYIDTENNPGELLIALENIERVMRKGKSYEEAVRSYGIPGHPYFKEFWPPTKYWGDARWVREKLDLPLDD